MMIIAHIIIFVNKENNYFYMRCYERQYMNGGFFMEKKVEHNEQMKDRELLKSALVKLLDEIPLERLRALYIKALVAKNG